ncbi:unnamed protein product [Cercospora beticola]|nr:unnamed protein product [Cercospora beticola]
MSNAEDLNVRSDSKCADNFERTNAAPSAVGYLDSPAPRRATFASVQKKEQASYSRDSWGLPQARHYDSLQLLDHREPIPMLADHTPGDHGNFCGGWWPQERAENRSLPHLHGYACHACRAFLESRGPEVESKTERKACDDVDSSERSSDTDGALAAVAVDVEPEEEREEDEICEPVPCQVRFPVERYTGHRNAYLHMTACEACKPQYRAMGFDC